MYRFTLDELQDAIRSSWSKETSHSPDLWDESCPSAGQCWTSAYVVRHFIGGKILIAEVLPHTDPISRHAWNSFDSGLQIDITRDQFPRDQKFEECDIPEDVILKVSGKQAQLLLERVSRKLKIDCTG